MNTYKLAFICGAVLVGSLIAAPVVANMFTPKQPIQQQEQQQQQPELTIQNQNETAETSPLPTTQSVTEHEPVKPKSVIVYNPHLNLDSNITNIGKLIRMSAYDFPPDTQIFINFDAARLTTISSNWAGKFNTNIRTPIDAALGPHAIRATDGEYIAQAPIAVVEPIEPKPAPAINATSGITDSTSTQTISIPQPPQPEPITIDNTFVTTDKDQAQAQVIISQNVIEQGKSLKTKGSGFAKTDTVTISLNTAQIGSLITEPDGSLKGIVKIPETTLQGLYDLHFTDNANHDVSTSLTVLERKIVEKVEIPDKSTLSTFTSDFYPPRSNVTINGLLNLDTNWWYGQIPTATFTATDDYSGIEYIVVQYRSFACQRSQCLLQPGESLRLNENTGVNAGNVVLWYFAKDKSDHLEERHRLSIWVDTTRPSIYVLKISTETRDNIPTGFICQHQFARGCQYLKVSQDEKITFDLLGSDLISGINSINYRILRPFYPAGNWTALNGMSITLALNTTGPHAIQFAANDIAGNVSEIKTFWVNVAKKKSE